MNTIEPDYTPEETDGKMYINFVGVTSNYVKPELLSEINRWSPNQVIIYRHNHPAKKQNGEILGRVIESEIKDVKDKNGSVVKGIVGRAEIFDITDFHKDIRKYINKKRELKDPVKISIGYQPFYQGNDMVNAQVYEYSLTYNPVCTECITMEPDEKIVSELQEALNKSAGIVKTLEEGNKALTTKVTELESELKVKDNKIQEFETKLIETKDLMTQVKELEAKVAYGEKKPFIDKIFELEKDEDLRDIYKNWDVAKLEKRLEKVKSLHGAIVTETLEKSRNKATAKELEEQKKAIETMDLSNLDPIVANAIKGMFS